MFHAILQHPSPNKVSATEYPVEKPDSPRKDKTFVMHNAFGEISDDFRASNVNRRKKQNSHPFLTSP